MKQSLFIALAAAFLYTTANADALAPNQFFVGEPFGQKGWEKILEYVPQEPASNMKGGKTVHANAEVYCSQDKTGQVYYCTVGVIKQ
jgi:hypothetical protein